MILGILGSIPSEASAKSGRRVLRAELDGEAGVVVNCVDLPAPVLRTLTCAAEGKAHVRITVVYVDAKGLEKSEQFDSAKGIPMMFFPIRKITVEFVAAGKCVVELFAEK